MEIEQEAMLMLLWFSRNQFERRENLIFHKSVECFDVDVERE